CLRVEPSSICFRRTESEQWQWMTYSDPLDRFSRKRIQRRPRRKAPKRPRLYRVIVPVTDMRRAAEFYQGLLGVTPKQVSSGRIYFDCAGVILACYNPRADGDHFVLPHNPGHIYFAVDDLEAVMNRARVVGCRDLDEKIEWR